MYLISQTVTDAQAAEHPDVSPEKFPFLAMKKGSRLKFTNPLHFQRIRVAVYLTWKLTGNVFVWTINDAGTAMEVSCNFVRPPKYLPGDPKCIAVVTSEDALGRARAGLPMWPFRNLEPEQFFIADIDRDAHPNIRALAYQLATATGAKLACRVTDDGGLAVIRTDDGTVALSALRKRGAPTMLEEPAEGCVARLTPECIAERRSKGLLTLPLRELGPGQFFVVQDRAMFAGVRASAYQLAGATGARFACKVTKDGWLMVARCDDGSADLARKPSGRPGPPCEPTGKFLGTYERGSVKPFRKMEVGDWFFCPDAGQSIRVLCSTKAKAIGISLTCAAVDGGLNVIRRA